ncbi:acyltransferase, partial [Psychromonas sp. PRT-SC03]
LGTQEPSIHYSQNSPARYQKHHLLPIGEFVPFEKWLRPLAPYFNLPMSSFTAGAAIQKNLRYADTLLMPTLCYEIAFPELLRQNINIKTGVILALSNDAWFDYSIGPAQHLQIARMRAIEFERPLLRSTNTGITAIYDGLGKETGRLQAHQAGALHMKIQPLVGSTPYQRFGSLVLNIYCFGIIMLLILIFICQKNEK